ncbi:hypothetical protein OCOJLMKI_5034 [Methylobacterium iners]|uniref:O-antigen ligase-related domain-containing protein n=2 Tax=Methylobacterium iners TaxID=418707 RepID=A0ABQ4S5F7_9HYPH|nr:hypothetical protein OCOJLMKI_5034 [Methylobacterium iners]
MSAFHFVTYKPFIAGLSLNAISSLLIVIVSILIVKRRYLLRVDSLFLLSLLIIIILSGIVNGRYLGSANTIIKFMYLLSVAFLCYDALQRHGIAKVMGLLSVAFLLPISLQIVSYVIGPVKATEVDGSASYIGGYYHEAAFSIILVTFLFVACFTRVGSRYTLVFGCIGIIGLIAANYRTSILAAAPSILAFVVCVVAIRVRPSQRSAVTLVFLVLALTGAVAVSTLFAERFKDVLTIVENGTDFIKPPEYFSRMDKKVLSGRAYIWSVYLTPWLRSGEMNFLFGFGADSWQDLFHLYAHNTFVSYAYEFGIFGLVMFLAVLLRTGALAMRLRGVPRIVSLCGIVSFTLINMATMPLWLIEGNLLFAIILAYTWYSVDKIAKSKSSVLLAAEDPNFARTNPGLVR